MRNRVACFFGHLWHAKITPLSIAVIFVGLFVLVAFWPRISKQKNRDKLLFWTTSKILLTQQVCQQASHPNNANESFKKNQPVRSPILLLFTFSLDLIREPWTHLTPWQLPIFGGGGSWVLAEGVLFCHFPGQHHACACPLTGAVLYLHQVREVTCHQNFQTIKWPLIVGDIQDPAKQEVFVFLQNHEKVSA